MANLKIPTQLKGPDKIEVQLVRADYLETSNVFRTLFEVFLSLTFTIIGVVLSIESTKLIHILFLAVTGITTIAFLILTLNFYNKAKT